MAGWQMKRTVIIGGNGKVRCGGYAANNHKSAGIWPV